MPHGVDQHHGRRADGRLQAVEATGLVYTYTKGAATSDPWYFTAIDFRTGRTVYRRLAGTGVGYNNNYAGIALARNAAEYVGTLGGIVAMRDSVP